MTTLPTVKVKRDGPRGWKIINEADFTPGVHELWSEGEAIAEAVKVADSIPGAPQEAAAALAKINPPDLDGDGKPGGRLSKEEIMADLDRLEIEYDGRLGRDKLDAILRAGKAQREANINARAEAERG